jgi:hypothetical protein
MIKTEFTPLPPVALDKLIEAGNYVLEGKYGSYYIDYYDTDEEDDENTGAVILTAQDGFECIVVMPESITYKGAWIHVVDNEGYQYDFTLERRVTTSIDDISAELINL